MNGQLILTLSSVMENHMTMPYVLFIAFSKSTLGAHTSDATEPPDSPLVQFTCLTVKLHLTTRGSLHLYKLSVAVTLLHRLFP